jgi:TolB-like protein/Flp pilus assembly protein TadD/class 3 adenylate cyclase
MSDLKPDLRLEIAHVLFIDMVGYSKLLIDDQHELLQQLNQIVRNTDAFRDAESSGKLIRVPTGDGMALVFLAAPDAPVRCALEISRALRSQSELQIRMGIHSGPVSGIMDVNDRSNIAGTGINLAQRVMDCGDAGHILLSRRVAEDLAQYRQWRPYLHDLGEYEAKHAVRVHVFNFYTDELGNSRPPEKLTRGRAGKVAAAARDRITAVPIRNFAWLAVVMLCLAVAIGFWFLSHRAAGKLRSASAPNASAVAMGSAKKEIAVLPFKPLMAENRDQVLEMGMADSLITKLSNSRQIIVRALTSVRKYDGLDQDPVAAGRELQVNSVLEGNVQKLGDHIRVTTRLINVDDGSSLWAGTFNEKFTDVFSVQDAISQKVADALALHLSGQERERFTKRYTDNVEAYQLFLTGRYHLTKFIPTEIRIGIAFFNRAIDLDPKYALAYFGLAEAYRALAITSDVAPKETFPQAKEAARKAIEIDDSLAEAHASLSFTRFWFDWDWPDAEREAKRAISLNPNSSFAHIAYAHLLSDMGRHEEALSQATQARQLDPVSVLINFLEGAFLYHARRDDDAMVRLQKTLEIDPDCWPAYLFLGKIYMQRGKYSEAIATLTKAKELSHGNSETISMVGYVAALSGDMARARAVLDELNSLSTQRYIPPHSIAVVYLGLGQHDETLAWLEKAYQDHDVRLTFLKVDPKWDSFRSDPGFIAILRRIGL